MHCENMNVMHFEGHMTRSNYDLFDNFIKMVEATIVKSGYIIIIIIIIVNESSSN